MNLLPCRYDGGAAMVDEQRIAARPSVLAARAQRAGACRRLGIRPEHRAARRRPGQWRVCRLRSQMVEDLGNVQDRHRQARTPARVKAKLPEDDAGRRRHRWLTLPPDRTAALRRRPAGGEWRRRLHGQATLRTTAPGSWSLPVLVLVAFSAVIPLMTVVNYSVQDIFGPDQRVFVGIEWFQRGPARRRLARRVAAPAGLLRLRAADRDPAGHRPRPDACRAAGWRSSVCLVLMALPLLIPWNVVGTIWQIFGRGDIGLAGVTSTALGIDYNYTSRPDRRLDHRAGDGRLALDAAGGAARYAGLRVDPRRLLPGGPDRRRLGLGGVPLHPAAEAARVLTIAILLRFMDSFMIYTEPFVLTGGGPGNATTFLSISTCARSRSASSTSGRRRRSR